MKIWFLSLEPIEQRYGREWNSYFSEFFHEMRIDHEFIRGTQITSNLNGKFFLDPVQTNVWKFSQLQNLLQRIDELKDDDIIFAFDAWFPGIESLKYALTFLGKKTRIVGYIHAGTYDKWDLTAQYGMESWGKDLENSWFQIYDIIFAATNYHKELIESTRTVPEDKIRVVGFPLDINGLTNRYEHHAKEYAIAFTGRKSAEKGFEDILELQRRGYPVLIMIDETKTKLEYYDLLSRCEFVISTSQQETFGIGIVEGIAMGCLPIVPNRLSYPETAGIVIDEPVDIVKDIDPIMWGLRKENRKYLIDRVQRFQYETVLNNILEELLAK